MKELDAQNCRQIPRMKLAYLYSKGERQARHGRCELVVGQDDTQACHRDNTRADEVQPHSQPAVGGVEEVEVGRVLVHQFLKPAKKSGRKHRDYIEMIYNIVMNTFDTLIVLKLCSPHENSTNVNESYH